uniref:Uncharacterized protein n=1 Tax=uncultured marine virus TaxID=186617 RepID=A0A0F7L870_9VIRU|nr:hypothetical protein [uncultured marine virus]
MLLIYALNFIVITTKCGRIRTFSMMILCFGVQFMMNLYLRYRITLIFYCNPNS